MMKEPDKNILDRFATAFKNIWSGQHRESTMKRVKMAALAMLPSWDELADDQEDRRAERLLEKVDQVCFCVRNCFLNEDLSTDTRAMVEVSLHVESVVWYCMSFYALDLNDKKLLPFITHDSIYAIARICHGNSVCPSVTRVDQSKVFEVRIMQFSPYSSPIPLVSAG